MVYIRDIKIDNYIRMVVGNIKVDVSIEFTPLSYPNTMQEKLDIVRINTNLSRLAGQLEYEIKRKIEEVLKVDKSE